MATSRNSIVVCLQKIRILAYREPIIMCAFLSSIGVGGGLIIVISFAKTWNETNNVQLSYTGLIFCTCTVSYILHMLSIFLIIGHLFVSVDWFHLGKCNSYYNTRISAWLNYSVHTRAYRMCHNFTKRHYAPSTPVPLTVRAYLMTVSILGWVTQVH